MADHSHRASVFRGGKRAARSLLIPAMVAAMSSGAMAETFWSAISTSCVPASKSIQGNSYKTAGDSAVAHRTGSLSKISLVCPVAPSPGGPIPNVLKITYLDSTGTSKAAYVKAEFTGVSRTTGVRSVIAVVNSNSSSQTSLGQISSASFVHAMNFETTYYFVRIEMGRKSKAQNVRAVGVALEGEP